MSCIHFVAFGSLSMFDDELSTFLDSKHAQSIATKIPAMRTRNERVTCAMSMRSGALS